MKKLLILATSGTGKTTLRKYLASIPELKNSKITEVDDYLQFPPDATDKLATLKGKARADYWVKEEVMSSKRAIDDDTLICFTVGVDYRVRQVFLDCGFDIIILDLSDKDLLKRISGRNKKIQVDLAVSGLHQLRKLPYPKLDASNSTEEIAKKIYNILISK